MLTLALSDEPSVTGIQRGTGEIIECRTTPTSSVCAGQNASGRRLMDRVLAAVMELSRATTKLTKLPAYRRAPDGTITSGDMAAIQPVFSALPKQLQVSEAATDREVMFVFLREAPPWATRVTANNPYGFLALVRSIRQGAFGAGDLIDRPFPVGAVLFGLAGAATVGGAVYLARRR